LNRYPHRSGLRFEKIRREGKVQQGAKLVILVPGCSGKPPNDLNAKILQREKGDTRKGRGTTH